jgi:hypothetical protein
MLPERADPEKALPIKTGLNYQIDSGQIFTRF